MGNRAIIRQMWGLLERIDAGLITRDPGNSRSAEAYDGLRKQLNQASKNRRIHVSHLLSLSDSIERGSEYQLIKDRVNDFLNEMGVSRFTDLSRTDFFEIKGGVGDYLKCVVPAVVETLDDGTLSLVRLGEAERTNEQVGGNLPISKIELSVETEDNSRGVKVAVGITIAIVGFFFGWILASNLQDNPANGTQQIQSINLEIVR